jgi:pimeloyl-ACP methyl ester carboxylesterase
MFQKHHLQIAKRRETMKRLCVLLLVLTLSISFAVELRAKGKKECKGIGIVLLHGNGGTPYSRMYVDLVKSLKKDGAAVVMPEMPWSGKRQFSKPLEKAMTELDTVVKKVKKKKKVSHIVVMGHSFGASAAIRYSATRSGIAGVVAIGPAPAPDTDYFKNYYGKVIKKAQDLIAAGKGKKKVSFSIRSGRKNGRRRTMPAYIYMSYYNPEGSFLMSKNAAALKPGTALLWVVGDRDQFFSAWGTKDYAFDKAPDHPKNAFLVVKGTGHLDVLSKAKMDIVNWVRALR